LEKNSEEPITAFRGEHTFLSNFQYSPILLAGLTYPSVEHAYVAMKSTDRDFHAYIASCMLSPGAVKHLGRRVRPLRPDWGVLRLTIMNHLVRLKFLGHDASACTLREKLLATGDADLIEVNNWGDRFWGVVDGTGSNNLGQILMTVRAEARRGELL
jgi:ribA/ribD-fused uncharacterized protein